MNIYNDFTEGIGGTPLVRFSKRFSERGVCLGKLEGLNPGGSMKDRAMLNWVHAKEKKGILKPGSELVMSSSGNAVTAMAKICARRGYHLTCVVDPKIAPITLKKLILYGASIEKITKCDAHDQYLPFRKRRAKEIAEESGAVLVDQYNDNDIIMGYRMTLAQEIERDLDEVISMLRYIVVAAGTGGTILGIAEHFKEYHPHVKIVGVDERGSRALDPRQQPRKRGIPGMGTAIPSQNYEGRRHLIDIVRYVDEKNAIDMALHLARSEGILPGGSSGAVLYVMRELAKGLSDPLGIIVGVLPDMGDKYIETLYAPFCVDSIIEEASFPSYAKGAVTSDANTYEIDTLTKDKKHGRSF